MDNFNNFLYVRAKAVMKSEKEARQLVKDVFVDENQPKDAYKQIYKKGSHRFISKSSREAKELELWEEDAEVTVTVSEETMEEIGDVFELLPDLFFATVFACCYDGMSVKEAANVMGCSEGTIRYRLNYAKKCVQDVLGETPFSMQVVCEAIDAWMLRYIDESEKEGVSDWGYLVVPMPKKLKKQEEEPEVEEEPVVEETPVVEEEHKKSPAGKIILGILIILLLVGGAYAASQHVDWQQFKPATGESEITDQEQEDVVTDTLVEDETVSELTTPEVEQPETQEPAVPEVQEPEIEKPAESEYIFANSDKKLLTKKQLRKYTKKELRLARNEIYARYGVIFDDKELDAYFSSKSWYTPKMSLEKFYDKLELNDIEEENVALIAEIEREK